jgi:hypothetical protein
LSTVIKKVAAGNAPQPSPWWAMPRRACRATPSNHRCATQRHDAVQSTKMFFTAKKKKKKKKKKKVRRVSSVCLMARKRVPVILLNPSLSKPPLSAIRKQLDRLAQRLLKLARKAARPHRVRLLLLRGSFRRKRTRQSRRRGVRHDGAIRRGGVRVHAAAGGGGHRG